MMVIIWFLHHAVNFVSLLLEENIASIISISELVQVAAKVVWLQMVFPLCHFTTHLDQFTQLKMEAVHSSEMSGPIKGKNLKSDLCENLITCGCAILRLFWNVMLYRLVDYSFLPLGTSFGMLTSVSTSEEHA